MKGTEQQKKAFNQCFHLLVSFLLMMFGFNCNFVIHSWLFVSRETSLIFFFLFFQDGNPPPLFLPKTRILGLEGAPA